MKNRQLARAVCFQESADEGNADYIEGRLYRRFLSCFQKIKKVLAKDHPLMLQYYQRWDGPAFLSANFLLAQTA